MKKIFFNISIVSLFLIFSISSTFAVTAKLRVYESTSYSIVNDIEGFEEKGLGLGGGIALAYALKPKTKTMSSELAIVIDGSSFQSENKNDLSYFRTGWSFRMFFNGLQTVRPYFSHEISTLIIWMEDADGNAKSMLVTLALGLDIPVFYEDINEESSSIFFDVAYNSFALGFFNAPDAMDFKYLTLNLGYSIQF